MKKISYYWGELKNSFYNPIFYDTLKERTLSRSIGFIVVLCCASAIIFVGDITIKIIPEIGKLSKGDVVDKNYPEIEKRGIHNCE